MRNVVLYIAMSLDGYIADKNGGVSWISGDGSEIDNAGSYEEFLGKIDTVILGYNTYYQIVSVLSPDAWVYADKMSYVITHQHLENKDNIVFTDNLIEIITRLKAHEGQDIWVCGGASIINQLIELDMIDIFCITVIPRLLGGGVRLFDTHEKELQLKLVSTKTYNGMTDLIYERKL